MTTLQTVAIASRSMLAWSVGFAIVRNALPHRSIDFQNRCVSLVHALEAIVFSFVVVRDWHDPLNFVGQATNPHEVCTCAVLHILQPLDLRTPTQWWCLLVSLGYFAYDMMYCMCIEKSIPNTLHHAGTLLGMIVGVFAGQVGLLTTPARTTPEVCGTEWAGAGALPIDSRAFKSIYAPSCHAQGLWVALSSHCSFIRQSLFFRNLA